MPSTDERASRTPPGEPLVELPRAGGLASATPLAPAPGSTPIPGPEGKPTGTLDLIGHAHIDPVWLWQWQEGFAEIKATWRSALDRLREYPEAGFTASSAAFYAWVEQNEPANVAGIPEQPQVVGDPLEARSAHLVNARERSAIAQPLPGRPVARLQPFLTRGSMDRHALATTIDAGPTGPGSRWRPPGRDGPWGRTNARRWGAWRIPMRRVPVALAAASLLALSIGGAAMAQEAVEAPHPAHIHAGLCPAPGDVVHPLNDVVVPSDETVGVASAIPTKISSTVVEAALVDIVAGEFAINVHESADAMDVYIACGDLGGPMLGTTDLVVGLAEQNGSGHHGVAWLHDNGDGTTRVDIALLTSDGSETGASPAPGGSPAAGSPMAPGSPAAPETPATETPMAGETAAPMDTPPGESPAA